MVRRDDARRAHGDLLDRLAPWFWEEDPLADAVVAELDGDYRPLVQALSGGPGRHTPASVRALIEAHDHVPVWVDRGRADRGGRLFFRSGLVGAVVLGARSLVAGYCSPAGNKPLAMTGTLQHAGARRLAETGRYVSACCSPGGLEPGAPGWRISLQVRVMHASVRRLIHRSGRWRPDAWGAPINQHDLLATSLLFSVVFVDGLRTMGLTVGPGEASDHLHLWRWASWLMGVRLELLPIDVDSGIALAELILLTQGPPDADARRLVGELLEPSDDRRAMPRGLSEGLIYGLLPRIQADGLGLPRTPWRHVVPASRVALAPAELARRISPRIEARMVRAGERYWQVAIARGLGGAPARFAPLRQLLSPQRG